MAHLPSEESYLELFGPSQLDFQENFFDVTSSHSDPYRFYVNEAGLLTYSGGDGDFGLLVYKVALAGDFSLKLTIVVPEGDYHYANSGLFFGITDPRAPLDSLQQKPHWPADWRCILEKRSAAFIGDWTGYEIQLHAGREHDEREPNTRNGALYNLPVGSEPGEQWLEDYRFDPGKTYDVILDKRGQNFTASMRRIDQDQLVKVMEFNNQHPHRGQDPGFVGIQSYFNDGDQRRAFLFERVLLAQS